MQIGPGDAWWLGAVTRDGMTLPGRKGGGRRPDCLLIEGCDFERFPPGGQLATARQLMAAYGDRLALVGICTDGTPVGRWVQRLIDGTCYWFYGVRRRRPDARRPVVPARLGQFASLSWHRRGVLSLGVRAAILQAPEDLFAVAQWNLESVCFCFAGVSNPLTASRYVWARALSGWFDDRLFRSLERVDAIFASADERAVEALARRSRGRLHRGRVHLLPTSYDSRVFAPRSREEARGELGVEEAVPLLVCSGRVNRVKGWDLLLEVVRLLARSQPLVKLVFVGDGEDRLELARHARRLEVSDRVEVTGFVPPARVAQWLNAADVVVVASHAEGWSVAMLEALACGRPIVATDVSGARDMIREGANGHVVRSRDPEEFATAVRSALGLSDASRTSLAIARDYALPEFARRVSGIWRPLS